MSNGHQIRDQRDTWVEMRAQSQAALMMMDSLMIVLSARKIVPAEELIEAVELVIATKRGFMESQSEDEATIKRAIAMLTEITNSLRASG